MVKSKPHSEYWAGIHLSLESLTVLGLLVGLQLGELALGCLSLWVIFRELLYFNLFTYYKGPVKLSIHS